MAKFAKENILSRIAILHAAHADLASGLIVKSTMTIKLMQVKYFWRNRNRFR